MVLPVETSDRRDSLDRIKKILEIAVMIVTLTVMLIKAIQVIVKEFFPNKAYEILVVIVCALFSLALAITISLFRKKILSLIKRILLLLTTRRKKIRMYRIHPSRPVSIFAYLLILGSIIYFLGFRTDIWHITRSWWSGPQIDLTSRVTGQSFQPVINLPWFNYGQDFGQVAEWGWRGVSQNRGAMEAAFEKLRQSGVNCIAWFLLCDGRGSLKFDSNGYVTGFNPGFFEDYDAALEVAREHKIGIIWVLMDYYIMFPAKEENGYSIFGHADVIEQSEKRQSFFNNALKPLVRRYSYESQIAGWIIINEPENALREGYVSPQAMQAFTREAATLIKQNTYRQPVSIGSADLESLLEYSGKHSSDLDFLVFHHYEKFLPPPASHIRSLMQGGDSKPIYIGEFDLKSPPLPTAELVTWIQRLGYAGLWPWNANDNLGALPSPNEEAQSLCEIISTTNSITSQLQQQFQKRRDLDTDSLTASFRQDIDWWMQYWPTTVMPAVEQSMIQWSAEMVSEERKQDENRLWENDKLKWQNMLASRRAERQKELSKANESLAQNEALRNAEGINKSAQWVKDVKAELQNIETELHNQDNDLQIARQRIALHGSLVNYYRYKSKWAQALYQGFWHAENDFLQNGKRNDRRE
jgi:hypothetical protein